MHTDRERPAFVVGADGSREAESAARYTSRIADALGVRLLRAHVPEPASASSGLLEIAERERAGLVAVGGVHRYGVGRLPRDGVVDRLLSEASCPVLVVPPEFHDRTVRTVGIERESNGRPAHAVTLAVDLAAALPARLEVVDGEAERSASGLIRVSAALDLLLIRASELARHVAAHAHCPVLVTPAS